MITLDYTTYNPRWKHSGIRYSSWEAFAFALGYLANRLRKQIKMFRNKVIAF